MQSTLHPLLRSVYVRSGQVRRASRVSCCHLAERAVLRVGGADSASFLQGLMTNDMESLVTDRWRSLYCMFLNTQGRVLFDALIYPGELQTDFLLDVDRTVAPLAKKHLGFYKVRRKVSVELVPGLAVYAAYDEAGPVTPPSPAQLTQSPEVGSTFCAGSSQAPGLQEPASSPHCSAHPDPRLSALGTRLLLDTDQCADISPHVATETQLVDQARFTRLRCQLGVSEGVAELGVAKVTPLEFNLDYLHGVNFHKGCYIGQELTARTHHTGVIRKRILPLSFQDTSFQENIVQDATADLNVVNEKGKNVGKVKRIFGDVGLGLMRLKDTFEAEKLSVSGSPVTVERPKWWPADKEISSNSSSSELK